MSEQKKARKFRDSFIVGEMRELSSKADHFKLTAYVLPFPRIEAFVKPFERDGVAGNAPDYSLWSKDGNKIGAIWKKQGENGPYLSGEMLFAALPDWKLYFQVFNEREGDRRLVSVSRPEAGEEDPWK